MLGLIGAVLGGLGLVMSALKVLSPVLLELGKKLGLVDVKETPEDFGEKALQSDKTMEDFETKKEYVEYVKNVEIDETKRHSEKEQLEKTCEVMGAVLEEEFEESPIEDLASFVSKNEGYLTPDKISALYDITDKSEFKDIFNDSVGVMNGSVTDSGTIDRVIEKLAEVEKKLDPTLSDNEAKLNVIEARRQ